MEPIGYHVGMFQKLIAGAAWALLAFITYATLAPIRHRPTLSTWAGLEHFAAFAVLAALLCHAYPRRIELVCLIVVGSTVLLELMQMLTPDRHGEIRDAIEKIAGGAVGVFTGVVIRQSNKLLRQLQN